jgi:hypothetical protein
MIRIICRERSSVITRGPLVSAFCAMSAVLTISSKKPAATLTFAIVTTVDPANIAACVAFRLVLWAAAARTERILALFAVPDFLSVIDTVAHMFP